MLIKCDIEKCLYCVGHICVAKDYKNCPYYILREKEKQTHEQG